MDSHALKNKLKKYLFFVSIVFFGITSVHLIYSYIYSDSTEKAQKGGTISESFIGNIPNLNPLKYQKDDYNEYINNILYRSLSNYDSNKNILTQDLAKCNIENTKDIKCYLVENIKWSNGDDITTDDIIATYKTIQKYNTNPILKKILENIQISNNKNSITFKSNIEDVNILNILFQPILPKILLDKLDEKSANSNFSSIDGIYSGYYSISKISEDVTLGNKKLFLERNNLYIKNPVYIDNIILKYYSNVKNLLKQKNNINIFFDKNHLIGNSIPKLNEYKYILPQYVALFINKDKLEYPNLRNFILASINKDEILNKIGKQYNKKIDSPFLDNSLKLNINKNSTSLEKMLNSIGYYKKNYYLEKYKKYIKNPYLYSKEVEIKSNSGSVLKKDKKTLDITSIKNSITKENYNSHSKIIISPKWVDKYNFITNPNIELKGIINNNSISEIWINNEKINNYSIKNKNFIYKLSLKNGNIKLGENSYKIYFVKDNKKELIEEIVFFYAKNKKTLEKKEIDLISKLINKKIQEETEKLKENNIIETTENNNVITEEISEKLKQIRNIENNFYYDKDLKAYSLNLQYINGSEEIAKTALEIKKQLEKSGIKINLSPIKIKELANGIRNNKENYDLILAGINLSYYPFDLSKYFYSGQIDKGTNFSKIKNSNLDNILEDLKSSILIENNKKDLSQKEIIKILKKENIFMPIYSPYYSNLVLKNIEGYELPEKISKHKYRFNPLIKSYILKQKKIQKENKSTIGYFKFILNKLF